MIKAEMQLEALKNYQAAVQKNAEIQVQLLDAKAVLEKRQAEALVAGVEGKNEGERRARLELMFATEVAAVNGLEKQLILARAATNIAEMTLRTFANMAKQEATNDG